MHPRLLLVQRHLLLLLLIVLTALFETTESLSDRPVVAPPSATAANRISNCEEVEAAAASTSTSLSTNMASLSPEYSCLVNDPLPEMPLLPITSYATVRACRAMKISSRDVFVCSYPKSGTTWTQNIVVRLLWEIASGNSNNNGSDRPLPEDWHLSHSAPFYEVDQYWRRARKDSKSTDGNNDEEEPMERLAAQTPIQNENEDEYRVFNTHLLPHQLPPNAKCVYVVRDPLDVMVSFYHHLSNQAVEDGGFTGTLEEFFEGFLEGTIVYGKWQDHIEAWLENVDGTDKERNFLLLHYEDMKQDLARETKRLAKFLSDDDNKSSEDRDLDEIAYRVVPHCTFDAMKRERKRYTPLTVSWKVNPKTGKPYDKFIRKGTIGDGRKLVLETPSSSSSSALKDRWIDHDAPIAKARWNKAGVEQEIIDRYL